MRARMAALAGVERAELPFGLLMFLYFFLVTTTFWILKPLKKTLFIQFYDQRGLAVGAWHVTAAEAELLAKVANMLVAFAAVVAFTWLARRLRRQQLTYAFAALFLAGFAAYVPVVSRPGPVGVWSFYLFGDLFSTLMVATFFAFLNDSVTPSAARRLYALVGLGGVIGGVFGSTVISTLIDRVGSAWWLWVCCGLGILIAVVAHAAGRRRPASDDAPAARDTGRPVARSAALEGAALVARSPYLLAVVAIVGLYEMVSTVMDFQFTSTVSHYLAGDAIGEHLSLVFAITNATALTVQVLLTGPVMRRLGVGIALLVLPAMACAGSVTFLAAPTLWIGSLLNTADNGFSYSINQSAREALYVPTTPDEKYKAKAFIDMFVQRFAKALAVAVSLAMGAWFESFASVRWLSLFTVTIVAAWIVAARYAGRQFDRSATTR